MVGSFLRDSRTVAQRKSWHIAAGADDNANRSESFARLHASGRVPVQPNKKPSNGHVASKQPVENFTQIRPSATTTERPLSGPQLAWRDGQQLERKADRPVCETQMASFSKS